MNDGGDRSSMELGAFPGGRVLFASSEAGREADFFTYTFGASFRWNVSFASDSVAQM
jgi:hypothetical protein